MPGKDSIPITPHPNLKPLSVFIGKWNTTGTMINPEDKNPIEIKGTDTYRWMIGGFFVIHEVDVTIGGEKVVGTEIIGYHDEANTFFAQSFDNRGGHVRMKAEVKDNNVAFTGKTERFKGSVNPDGNVISGEWERLEDDTWHHWMDVTLTKI